VRQSLRDFVDEESDDEEHDIYAEEGNKITEGAEAEIALNISRALAAL
jgi:hypothetical protein